jgi:outer membrane protein OmpA-like peptidoglycan-associated protein
MKQLLFSILFFMITFSGFGQQKSFSVSGKVIDCRENNPIKDVTIRLKGNDNSDITVKTDSLGNYVFTNCFKNNMNYVLKTDGAEDIGRGPAVKYGLCPYTHYEKSGYGNSEKYSFTYSDTTRKIEHDICLALSNSCVWIILPDFYFKKNSTDFEQIDYIGMKGNDTIVDCLVAALIARKTWVINLSAHASCDEDNKKELAEARAKKVYDLLVSKGLNPERIKYKSYAATRPIKFYDEFDKVIIKDKKTTNEKSRRVVLDVLSRDFGLEEQKNTNKKESEKEEK